jgi:DNA-binding transcriptional LysR family regulator
MNLGMLTTFLAVTKHRNVTKAARELNLTQPGVSRQIQKLERDLGGNLFERHYRDLVITPLGERTRRYALDAVLGYQKLKSHLHASPSLISGPLKLCASSTPGEYLVPELVTQFNSLYKDVLPEIFSTDSAAVVDEILGGHWDIGFTGIQPSDKRLTCDVIGQDEIMLAVPDSHRFAQRKTIPLDALVGERFILREGGSGTLQSVESALRRKGLKLPPHQIAIGVNSMRGVLSAVENGYGIGWVSSLALRQRDTGIAFVRLAGINLRRSLYLVTERRRLLPLPASAFLNWFWQSKSTRKAIATNIQSTNTPTIP